MNFFLQERKHGHVNVEVVKKVVSKVFLNLNGKILKFRILTLVHLEEDIKDNMIIVLKNLLFKKCIFKKYVNLLHQLLMKNVSMNIISKHYCGIEFSTIKWLE